MTVTDSDWNLSWSVGNQLPNHTRTAIAKQVLFLKNQTPSERDHIASSGFANLECSGSAELWIFWEWDLRPLFFERVYVIKKA
jgi:hypothetical protein